MPILTDGKVVMSLVMLAIFVGMVLMSLAYPPDARLLPLVIGIPGITLALFQVMIEVLASRRGGGRDHGPSSPSRSGDSAASAADISAEGDPQSLLPVKQEVVLFVYLAGLMIALLFLGFWITVPLFLIAFFWINERLPWPRILMVTIIGWGSLYLIFEIVLGIVLHEGFLINYFSE